MDIPGMFPTIAFVSLTVDELTELYDIFQGMFSGTKESREIFLGTSHSDPTIDEKDEKHENSASHLDPIAATAQSAYQNISQKDERDLSSYNQRLRAWLTGQSPHPLDFDSVAVKEVLK